MLTKTKEKLGSWAYRCKTFAHAFKTLYTLPQEKVDAFIKSYKIYDYDWADEKQLLAELGPNYYEKIKQGLVDWYSVLNYLCALGQVEKMYIPPAVDPTKNILTNQVLFERMLAQDLGLKKGDRALDIGCGRGRIAGHIASVSGAHVTGINIDETQLKSAEKYAREKGLPCEYKNGDVNSLPFPFPDGSFDGVYHVQVFSLSKDMGKLFKEIYRLLKPGARFGCLDWVRLPAYNPQDPHHVDLMRRVKPLIGAIGTLSPEEYTAYLKEAGFKILIDRNASVDGLTSALIDRADQFFTRLTRLVHFLVRIKAIPAHFRTLLDRLTMDGQAFVEADRKRLMTTSHYIVAEKPK